MGARQNFTLLPYSLRVAFFLFLLVPWISTELGQAPWQVIAGGQVAVILSALTYWIFPLMLSLSIVVKHTWFLPVSFVQALALGVHCFFYRQEEGLSGSLLRFGLIACMVGLSLLFADKDFLRPFLSKRSRFWRRSRRTSTHHPVEILTLDGRRFKAEINDCSLTGMGIRLESEEGQRYLAALPEGAPLDLEVSLSSGRYMIPTFIRWFDGGGSLGRMGVAFKNPRLMGAIVASVTGQLSSPWHPVRERFAYYWLKGGVKHVALLFWVCSIAGAFFMPVSGF